MQPIFAAIEHTAAQRDTCSLSCSKTIRTARARTSGENLFVVLLVMAPLSQELEPPAIPGRFKVYLHAYTNVPEARAGISRYIQFFNAGRPHSSLDGRTPDEAYFNQLPSMVMAA